MKTSLIKSLVAIAATFIAASAMAQKAPFGNLTPAQAALWNQCADDYTITLNKNSTTTNLQVGSQFWVQYIISRKNMALTLGVDSYSVCTNANFAIPVPAQFNVKTAVSSTNGVPNSPKTFALVKYTSNNNGTSVPFSGLALVGTVPTNVTVGSNKVPPASVTTITLVGKVAAALPLKVGVTTTSNVDYIWEYSPKDNAVNVTFTP